MKDKQRQYWANLISYILSSQDVIDDIANLDGNAARAATETEERLKFLTSNYILRRKPKPFVFFLVQKNRVQFPAAPIIQEGRNQPG